MGAMETSTASEGLAEGAGSISWVALTGPREQKERRPGYLEGGRLRGAPTTARERTAAEQPKREK
jgi:hypothetical protein